MAEISSKMRKKMEERKKKIKSSQGGLGYIVIKEGVIRVRPLPVPPEEEPGLEVIQFYFGGDLGGFISPASIGKPCAVYEFYQDAMKGSDKGKKKIAQKIPPKSRFMMAVLKYTDTKGKEIDERDSPKLVLMTGGLYQQCIDVFIDADDWGDFTDPVDGYDLKLGREGKGQFDTEYSANPCPKTKLAKQFRGKTYDAAKMLEEILPTYEETETKLEEYLSSLAGTEDEEDENDGPIAKKKKKKGLLLKKKSKGDL